jgi:hypothetical protein
VDGWMDGSMQVTSMRTTTLRRRFPHEYAQWLESYIVAALSQMNTIQSTFDLPFHRRN